MHDAPLDAWEEAFALEALTQCVARDESLLFYVLLRIYYPHCIHRHEGGQYVRAPSAKREAGKPASRSPAHAIHTPRVTRQPATRKRSAVG